MKQVGLFSQARNSIKAFFQQSDFASWGLPVLWILLILMFFTFVGVMFSDDITRIVSHRLGIHLPEDGVPRHKTLTFIFVMMGGVFGVIRLVTKSRRLATAQSANNELTKEGLIDKQFISATENLESDHSETRIAAFRRLYYLAKDSTDNNFRKNVFDVLCSHLRNITNKKDDKGSKYNKEQMDECQTLIDVLFNSESEPLFDKFSANLQKVNLAGMNLENINLSHANLEGADFVFANLRNANLANANLKNANLEHAHFIGTDLEGAHFDDACLAGATFTSAYLFRAYFSRADLTGANFENANLSRANFSLANFSGANLRNANLESTNLSRANLSRANFEGANLVCTCWDNISNIEGAKFGSNYIVEKCLPKNKGRYIATWTSDKFWAEAEKNEES